jgi:aminoglycoside phosphotransferase (APT) family kinase protein
LDGESADRIEIDDNNLDHIALCLAQFLKELRSIDTSNGLPSGIHNWWRSSHLSVYNQQARTQIARYY